MAPVTCRHWSNPAPSLTGHSGQQRNGETFVRTCLYLCLPHTVFILVPVFGSLVSLFTNSCNSAGFYKQTPGFFWPDTKGFRETKPLPKGPSGRPLSDNEDHLPALCHPLSSGGFSICSPIPLHSWCNLAAPLSSPMLQLALFALSHGL